MKILMAKNLGFCTGVNSAYKIAVRTAKTESPVYILGELVHNQKVIDELKEKGVLHINSIDELPKGSAGSIIISAHGLPPEMHDRLIKTGLKIIDTTCPWVKRPQMLAKELVQQGYHLVIVGDKKHAEVVGIHGWSGKKAQIIENAKDAKRVLPREKIAVLAQTTQSAGNFEEVVNELAKKTSDLKVCNTICESTNKRQRSAVDVAKRSEIMLVIGDSKSANTRRLKELCEDTGARTYLVESADSLELNLLKGFDIIGITAGASTPEYVINDVLDKLKGA
jgi:small subunit ribosomal protein S1